MMVVPTKAPILGASAVISRDCAWMTLRTSAVLSFSCALASSHVSGAAAALSGVVSDCHEGEETSHTTREHVSL